MLAQNTKRLDLEFAICEKERNALIFGSGQEFKTCTQLEKLTCKCINMDIFDRKKCLK